VHPDNRNVVDEVTAIKYDGVRSFTGEEMVEVISHGGEYIPNAVLGALLAGGARVAGPGEFTRRAVENGRMDLLRAEAIDALIRSQGEEERAWAMAGYLGGQQEELAKYTDALRGGLAVLEAQIEAGDSRIWETELETALSKARIAAKHLRDELGAGEQRMHGRGCESLERVVLCGEPNVGKSTLFNTLVGDERAIVDTSAGTTRDFISERLRVGGCVVEIVDTAGLRDAPEGRVELLGVQRAWVLAREAGLAVLLSSAERRSFSEVEERLLCMRGDERLVVVVSKIDVWDGEPKMECCRKRGVAHVGANLRDPQRAESVRGMIAAIAERLSSNPEKGSLVQNERQAEVVRGALAELEWMEGTVRGGEVFAAEALRRALCKLGEFSGIGVGKGVLEEVFARFCVGK
jgi:tRNA modification GTPase